MINFGKVLSGDWDYVSHEIGELQHVTNGWRGIFKVIFETGYLDDDHILRLCDICSQHQVGFVKTSTGFGYARQPDGTFAATGATESHVRMMREHCPASVGVKASGGIRTLDDLLRMVEAGANRIGASSTEFILREARERGFPEI